MDLHLSWPFVMPEKEKEAALSLLRVVESVKPRKGFFFFLGRDCVSKDHCTAIAMLFRGRHCHPSRCRWRKPAALERQQRPRALVAAKETTWDWA